MIDKRVIFIPEEHAERVILIDSFGKKHELKINLLTTDNPEAQINQEIARMEKEEQLVIERASARGHSHPALTGSAVPDEGCKDCE